MNPRQVISENSLKLGQHFAEIQTLEFSKEPADWNCESCKYLNKSTDIICGICRTSRELEASRKWGARALINEPQTWPKHEDSRRNIQRNQTNQTYELRIVVIGKTGSGKSATGNTILGKKEFKSLVCGSSVTNKCKLGTTERYNRKIVLVDTPGLFDTGMTNKMVTKEIVKCITLTSPGPHAIILTVSITSRFTKEEQDTVKYFVDYFGPELYNYLFVVFTRADELECDNINIDHYIKESPEPLKALLKQCNNRYIPFNNKLTGFEQHHQVKKLIDVIDAVVSINGGICYTNEMYIEAENILQRREMEVKRKMEEEKYRQFEIIKQATRVEYNEKIAKQQEEKKRLENKIKSMERENQIADSYKIDVDRKVAELREELRECKIQERERRENERMLQGRLHDLESRRPENIGDQVRDALKESGVKTEMADLRKQIDDKSRQDQTRQMDGILERLNNTETELHKQQNEQRIKDETIAELRNQQKQNTKKHKKELNEIEERCKVQIKESEETYRKQVQPTALRDNSRKECVEEKGLLSKVLSGVGTFCKTAICTVFPPARLFFSLLD